MESCHCSRLMQVVRFGLNDAMLPGENDLYVEYFESTLMVLVRGFMGY